MIKVKTAFCASFSETKSLKERTKDKEGEMSTVMGRCQDPPYFYLHKDPRWCIPFYLFKRPAPGRLKESKLHWQMSVMTLCGDGGLWPLNWNEDLVRESKRGRGSWWWTGVRAMYFPWRLSQVLFLLLVTSELLTCGLERRSDAGINQPL